MVSFASLPELPKKEEPDAPITPPSPDKVEPPRKDARSVNLPARNRAAGNSETTFYNINVVIKLPIITEHKPWHSNKLGKEYLL